MTSSPQTDADSDSEADARDRIRRQEIVAELGQRALETDDVAQVLHHAAAAVADGLDCEYASVLESLSDAERALLRRGVGWRDGLVGSATVSAEADSQVGDALRSDAPVVVDDRHSDEQDRFAVPELFTEHDVESGIAVPIVVGSDNDGDRDGNGDDEDANDGRDDEDGDIATTDTDIDTDTRDTWGVLTVHATDAREFSDRDVAFVERVADVLGSAIDEIRTKQRLCERAQELDETFDRITDAFLGLDRDWDITYINDRGAELLDPEDVGLVGENFWDPFEPALETTFEEEYRKTMASQEPSSFEEYYPPLDTWFEVHAYPSESGLSIYFRDVTERKEREQERELFRTLLDRVTDSVLVIEPETGQFEDVNEAACRRLGYDREELIGLTVPEMERRFDDIDDWRAHVEDVSGEGSMTIEGVHERKDGSTYPAEVNVTYVELDREYMVAIARDISGRKERERRLRESKQQYRTLAENLPNGVVTMFDDEFEYVLAAGRAFDDLPLSPTDVEGESVRTVWPEHVSEAIVGAFEDAIDGDGETQTIETQYADREWTIHVVPIDDQRGNVFGGMTIAQDVTERAQYRRQLERSERRYRTLAEHFPNGTVGVYDRDLRYTLVEGAAIGDQLPAADALEGERITTVVPDDTAEVLEPLFRTAIEDGETGSVTTSFSGRTWRVWATPLRGADETVFAGLSFAQDITEQVERQRKLEESNERLEQFAYAASHDLQEPLRMISSYLSLIERRHGEDLDEDGREFLDFAVDGAERMRTMIDGLLEYSRVDTQGDPLEPVRLADVLERARENLQVKIAESDAEITADDLPRVRGDESQLQQVFQNLLSNAIEYAGDEPPRIHVGADRRGSTWRIAVSDEGIGIDPEDQERVFEVFQRLHSREEYDGTGIGLALCQRIVERHGGTIRVDSEPGEGTTFSFTLPAVSE